MVTERRACRVVGLARNTQRRKPCVADDESQLVKRIVWMASEYGRHGYHRIEALLRSEGRWVNHKRVERIWREEALKVPAKKPKYRRPWLGYGACIRLWPTHRNHVKSYDFVTDDTADGRSFRMLTFGDEYTRECLAIDVSRKLTSEDILERLWDLFVHSRVCLTTSAVTTATSSPPSGAGVARESWRVAALHRAGIPLGERLHRERQREATGRACNTLLEARVLTERWRRAYNTVRPHNSRGYCPPVLESRRPCPLTSVTPQQADRGKTLAGQPW